MNGNQMFPVFLKLNELHTLIIGGGNVGLEKLEAILNNSPKAKITLVATEIRRPEIFNYAQWNKNLVLIERPFIPGDLVNKDIVIMATDDFKHHAIIKKLCRQRGMLANVADTPELCDFYLSSIVKKGDLKIAISSNGKSPTMTKRIKQYLEQSIPDDVQHLLSNMEKIRKKLNGDFSYKVKSLNSITDAWLRDNR